MSSSPSLNATSPWIFARIAEGAVVRLRCWWCVRPSPNTLKWLDTRLDAFGGAGGGAGGAGGAGAASETADGVAGGWGGGGGAGGASADAKPGSSATANVNASATATAGVHSGNRGLHGSSSIRWSMRCNSGESRCAIAEARSRSSPSTRCSAHSARHSASERPSPRWCAAHASQAQFGDFVESPRASAVSGRNQSSAHHSGDARAFHAGSRRARCAVSCASIARSWSRSSSSSAQRGTHDVPAAGRDRAGQFVEHRQGAAHRCGPGSLAPARRSRRASSSSGCARASVSLRAAATPTPAAPASISTPASQPATAAGAATRRRQHGRRRHPRRVDATPARGATAAPIARPQRPARRTRTPRGHPQLCTARTDAAATDARRRCQRQPCSDPKRAEVGGASTRLHARREHAAEQRRAPQHLAPRRVRAQCRDRRATRSPAAPPRAPPASAASSPRVHLSS